MRASLVLRLALCGTLLGPTCGWGQARPHLTIGQLAGAPMAPEPVLDLNGAEAGIDFSATFIHGGGAVRVVDGDASDGEALSVMDNSNHLVAATIRLTNNLNGAAETLAVTTAGTNIVATLGTAGADRTLTLTGFDSKSAYQQVLRTATYNNTAASPNTTQRSIEFRLNDGSSLSAIAVSRVTIPNPVPLIAIVSQKVHGSAGTFEISLLSANPVECRSGGAGGTHVIVFRFSNSLSSVNSVSFTGAGSVTSSGIGADAREYIVNLGGVTDVQRCTVQLTNVTDTGGNQSTLSAPMGVLLGDTTGSGSVTATDIAQTKARSGQAVTSTNFRSDIVVNGSINATDIGQVKVKSGNVLP